MKLEHIPARRTDETQKFPLKRKITMAPTRNINDQMTMQFPATADERRQRALRRLGYRRTRRILGL